MTTTKTLKPFYPYMGGKRRLLDDLRQHIPALYGNYHEPCLGGGALALDLLSKTPEGSDRVFYLSDLDSELMNCWVAVRDNEEEVEDHLRNHYLYHSNRYFYSVRNWDRLADFKTMFSSAERAGRYLYLLTRSFGAMLKLRGKNDLCYGSPAEGKDNHPDWENLRAVSRALRTHDVRIGSCPFQDTVKNWSYGDFLYLDPPYAEDTETKMTVYGEGQNDGLQEAVRDFVHLADREGLYTLHSNTLTPTTIAYFSDWRMDMRNIYHTAGEGSHVAVECLWYNNLLAGAITPTKDFDADLVSTK